MSDKRLDCYGSRNFENTEMVTETDKKASAYDLETFNHRPQTNPQHSEKETEKILLSCQNCWYFNIYYMINTAYENFKARKVF